MTKRRLVPGALADAERIAEAYGRGFREGLAFGRRAAENGVCRRLAVEADRQAARLARREVRP